MQGGRTEAVAGLERRHGGVARGLLCFRRVGEFLQDGILSHEAAFVAHGEVIQGPQYKNSCGNSSFERALWGTRALWFGAIDDGLEAVGNFEIGRHGE